MAPPIVPRGNYLLGINECIYVYMGVCDLIGAGKILH